MSQSKMSVTDDPEKKFVIKHVFKDVKYSGRNRNYEGPRLKHFGVPWKIRINVTSSYLMIYLDCLKFQGKSSWKISTLMNGKIGKNGDAMTLDNSKLIYPCVTFLKYYDISQLDNLLTDGNLTVEIEVKITEMSGIKFSKLRNFDDDLAKEHSDVVLKVVDQKFHVNKAYLSLHSTYFKSLFSGNFAESQKSEIELKDMDPEDLQKFLEVLYGEPAVDEDSVFGILQLADMYDSKTAINRCQEFFLFKSGQNLREKFHAAVKYNMEELKKKCLSEMKTVADYHSILPENPNQFDPEVWEELFLKALTVQK